jgi:hypothetical protein
MTGYIDTNNPISKMTIGSFADMGYEVDDQDFDTYLLSSLRSNARMSSLVGFQLRDRVLQPRWAISPATGHLRQLSLK